MRFSQIIAVTWLMLLSTVAAGHAEKRVALVVGNAKYTYADKLGNPVSDARGVRDMLGKLGFAPVEPAQVDDLCGGPVAVSFASRCAAPLTAAQERALKSKDSFRECENCPEMVAVPAGSFTMGSPLDEKDRSDDEGPQHTVTIGKPFAVGKVHVNVDQFAAFAKETGSRDRANWRTTSARHPSCSNRLQQV
jgi:formylglycine-generating enzyme required for sulfatase activity